MPPPCLSVFVAADLWGHKTNLSFSILKSQSWAGFVDAVECIYYAEAIARRPLQRPTQETPTTLRGFAGAQASPADRVHVCDVPTFVAESLWLLVHVCDSAPRWEQVASLDSLYNNCQLFIFQPEGSITGGDSVERVPKPLNRTAAMTAYLTMRAQNIGAQPTVARYSRSVSPTSNKKSRQPIFAQLEDAAMAIYLVLVRCQLRVAGVTSVLLKGVIEDVLVGLSLDNAAYNGASIANQGTISDEEVYIGGYSPRVTPIRRLNVASQEPELANKSRLLPKVLLDHLCVHFESDLTDGSDLSMLSLMRALRVINDATSKSPKASSPLNTPRGKAHRRCESPMCNDASPSQGDRSQFLSLSIWLDMCRSQLPFVVLLCHRLFGIPEGALPFASSSGNQRKEGLQDKTPMAAKVVANADISDDFTSEPRPRTSSPGNRKPAFNQYVAMKIRQ